jgi:cathepsin X
MQYTANNSATVCDPIDVCRDCVSPPPKVGETGFERCFPIQNYKRYYTSEYGSVRGVEAMKKEIFLRGPISCGIYSTPELHNYKTGIYF